VKSALPFLLALLLPPSQEPAIEVLFAPSGDARLLQTRLAREIRSSSASVRVAMFHFTSERLVQALAERRRAGVAVRVLLDARQADDDFVARLRSLRLDVRKVSPKGDEQTRFHHKYAILDDKIAVTGSYNWTVQGDRSNHENVVLLRDGAAARAFAETFDRVWDDPDLSRP
jgi:phosphatidylserine/phosphatidylglycerophosphate/cardiolipin synthase-like enzyme